MNTFNEIPIRLLICEDYSLIAEGLELQLKRIKRFKILGRPRNEKELFEFLKYRHNDVDILLLDMDIDDVRDAGLQILKRIKQREEPFKFKVLVLSSYDNDAYLIRKSLSLGASGYVSKGINSQRLTENIIRAFEGETHLLCTTISRTIIRDNAGEITNLTKKELEILKLVTKGLPVQEIADQLHVSKRTVDTHKYNIRQKLSLDRDIDFLIWVCNYHRDWLDEILAND